MRITFLASFVGLILITACGATDHSAPDTSTSQSSPQPASNAADLPIAQYLGHDDATGARVFELLRDAGIESSAGGSIGFSVWVSGSSREKARQVLLSAANAECLPISILDDQGNALANTRPSRCPNLAPPAPVGGSAK